MHFHPRREGGGNHNRGHVAPGQFHRLIEKECQEGEKAKRNCWTYVSGVFFKEKQEKRLKKKPAKISSFFFLNTFNNYCGIKPYVMFIQSLDRSNFPRASSNYLGSNAGSKCVLSCL